MFRKLAIAAAALIVPASATYARFKTTAASKPDGLRAAL
jgi:hypothetical protein